MVSDLIRESFVGQLVYRLSGRRAFQYAEEKPGFTLPERYTPREKRGAMPTSRPSESDPAGPRRSEAATLVGEPESSTNDVEKGNKVSKPTHPKNATEEEPRSDEDETWKNTVDWYGPDDPECPMNWSFAKKCFVSFDIGFITFSIYIGSAIYSPGTQLVAEDFGISPVAATLGLTMFVLGYGVGPMFLSPLSEIPQFGRTSVYIITLAIFVILQVPTALATNLGTLLPLRFLAGFFGSPPLATGGASIADMWDPASRAIVIGLWGCAAVCGPVLGPLIGGFAAQAEGWRWTIWILLWLSGFALVFLSIFLPETSSEAILYRRAVRLRRLTGNPNLKSEGEREGEHMSIGDVAQMTFVRPFVLGFTEPIVFAWNIYIALVYGILYIWIESYSIIFVEGYGFNLGENGLAFMGQFVGAIIGFIILVPYIQRYLRPKLTSGNFVPENRLPPALIGAVFLPISLFWFGWTADLAPKIHWIVPILASMFYSLGVFGLFQAGLNYLQDCYPRYVASILAGNDFFRACLGAGFPLFSTAFFNNLGVGPACSLLGGLTCLMLPIPWLLWKYGDRIRARSPNCGL